MTERTCETCVNLNEYFYKESGKWKTGCIRRGAGMCGSNWTSYEPKPVEDKSAEIEYAKKMKLLKDDCLEDVDCSNDIEIPSWLDVIESEAMIEGFKQGRQQAVREAIEKVKELKEYHSANADEAGRVREWESFNKEGYVSMKLEEVLSILKQVGGGE